MQIILNKLNEILQYVKSTDPSRYMTIKEVCPAPTNWTSLRVSIVS